MPREHPAGGPYFHPVKMGALDDATGQDFHLDFIGKEIALHVPVVYSSAHNMTLNYKSKWI